MSAAATSAIGFAAEDAHPDSAIEWWSAAMCLKLVDLTLDA